MLFIAYVACPNFSYREQPSQPETLQPQASHFRPKMHPPFLQGCIPPWIPWLRQWMLSPLLNLHFKGSTGTTAPQDAGAMAKVLPLGLRECLNCGCSTQAPTPGKGDIQHPVNHFWDGRSRCSTKDREAACSIAVCHTTPSAFHWSRIFLKSCCSYVIGIFYTSNHPLGLSNEEMSWYSAQFITRKHLPLVFVSANSWRQTFSLFFLFLNKQSHASFSTHSPLATPHKPFPATPSMLMKEYIPSYIYLHLQNSCFLCSLGFVNSYNLFTDINTLVVICLTCFLSQSCP